MALVISRKANQGIVIGGGIRVVVQKVKGQHVTLAIEAPRDVRIVREELIERDRERERVAG